MNRSATIDPQALAALRELNPDNPAFLRELVDLFISDVGERLAELDRALATQDASLLARAAHTIKGSCSNFGAGELMRISQAVELRGKAGDLAGAATLLPALKAESTAVTAALRQC